MTAQPDDDDDGSICPNCAGSGEGMADGTICRTCGGSGDDTHPWGRVRMKRRVVEDLECDPDPDDGRYDMRAERDYADRFLR